MKTSSGLGPAVYLDIMIGRIICIGTIGTANMAMVVLAIPDSIIFNPVKESAAENAI